MAQTRRRPGRPGHEEHTGSHGRGSTRRRPVIRRSSSGGRPPVPAAHRRRPARARCPWCGVLLRSRRRGRPSSTSGRRIRCPPARSRRLVLGGHLRPPRHLVAGPDAAGPLRARAEATLPLRGGGGGAGVGVRDPRREPRRDRPVDEPARPDQLDVPAVYLATRITIATAVIVTASPDLARPRRLIGRWLIAIGALAAIALGVALPIGVAAGFLTGFGAAALVHLLVGSPGGRPRSTRSPRPCTNSASTRRRRETHPSSREVSRSPSRPTPRVNRSSSRSSVVTPWDGQFVAATWYRSGTGAKRVSPDGSTGRARGLRHVRRAGGWRGRGGGRRRGDRPGGRPPHADATGRPLGSVPPEEVDVHLLHGAWQALIGLHDVGIAHGRIDGRASSSGRMDRRLCPISVKPDAAPTSALHRPRPPPCHDGAHHRHRSRRRGSPACSATMGWSRSCRTCSRRRSSTTRGKRSRPTPRSQGTARATDTGRGPRSRRSSPSTASRALRRERRGDRVHRLHDDLRPRRRRHRPQARRGVPPANSWSLDRLRS